MDIVLKPIGFEIAETDYKKCITWYILITFTPSHIHFTQPSKISRTEVQTEVYIKENVIPDSDNSRVEYQFILL